MRLDDMRPSPHNLPSKSEWTQLLDVGRGELDSLEHVTPAGRVQVQVTTGPTARVGFVPVFARVGCSETKPPVAPCSR